MRAQRLGVLLLAGALLDGMPLITTRTPATTWTTMTRTWMMKTEVTAGRGINCLECPVS